MNWDMAQLGYRVDKAVCKLAVCLFLGKYHFYGTQCAGRGIYSS